MGLFKRDKATPAPAGEREVLQPVYQPSETVEAARPASPSDVDTARDTLENITSELKISSDQHLVASKRVAGLAMTISKMEAGLRHMSRLEAQCVKLEDELSTLQKRYSQKETWASEQERILENLQKQHHETRQELELAQSELLVRQDRETKHVESIGAQAAKIEGLDALVAERDDRINTLSMVNLNLQEDVSAQSVTLSQQSTRIHELTKSIEEMVLRVDKKTKHNDQLMSELSTLRLDHNELKSQYFEKVSALEHAQYDLKTQRTVLDEGLKRRDEDAYALKTRIEQLTAQLRIKDNMSGHLDEEIVSLRANIDSERQRTERMKARLRDKTEEADKATAALVNTKADYDALSAKHDKAMHDLDAVRRLSHIQKQKLERYASIAALNAATPEDLEIKAGLLGGTGERETPRRDSYLSNYETAPQYETRPMSEKTPSNVDLPESDTGPEVRDIPGRQKI
jgi:chromosome segregation ATPase